MDRILITGANGYVARHTIRTLVKNGYEVTATVRSSSQTSEKLPAHVKLVVIEDLSDQTDWTEALNGVSIVIHAAARVHMFEDTADNPLDIYRKINRDGSLSLARQAKDKGISHFIFVSSIFAHGEQTTESQLMTSHSPLNPISPYGLSKKEAELGLRDLFQHSSVRLSIVRPPMIYGPDCKGNFTSLVNLCKWPIPLPFGLANQGKRNFLYIENLTAFFLVLIKTPSSETAFVVGDPAPISFCRLIEIIRSSLGMKKNIYSLPGLPILLTLIGQKKLVHRFFESLEIDTQELQTSLNWTPPFSTEEGIQRTLCYSSKKEALHV